MSIEKKLGLSFLGLLVLAFCGVLAIRLTDVAPEPPINVDLRDSNQTAAAPPAATTATRPGNAHGTTATLPTSRSFATSNQPAGAGGSFGTPTSANGASFAARNPQTAPPAPADHRYGSAVAGAAPADNRYGSPSGGLATSSAAPTSASSDPFRGGGPNGSNSVSVVGSTPSAGGASASTSAAGPYGAPSNRYGTPGATTSNTLPTFGAASPTTTSAAASMAPPAGGLSGGNPLRGASVTSSSSPTLPTGPSPAAPSFASPAFSSAAQSPQAMSGVPAPPSTGFAAGAISETSAADRGPGVAALAAPASRMAPSVGSPATLGAASANAAGSGVAPASASLPLASSDRPYTVGPDDSFWSISEKAYGDGAYYRALYAYNSDRYPHAEDVRVGSVLDLPDVATLKRRFPELIGNAATAATANPTLTAGASRGTGAASYVVQDGDTLFEIARKQLGKASRWTEIYQLNRAALGDNLENLRPGLPLALPTGTP